MATPPITVTEQKLGREQAAGLVYKEAGVIFIDPRQSPKDYLDTLIHEVLHVAHPKMTEKEVIRTAQVLTKVLWKNKYRKISQ